MSIAGLILVAGLLLFMAFGMPIAFSLGISTIISILIDGRISLDLFPQRLFGGLDSFPLLAVIFFLAAGELMMQGGITRRLINFAKIFFNRIYGSLSFITFAACALFGAISGSAMATTAAIGGVMYPEMTKDGAYEKQYAATCQAVGGTLGTMIPPSLPLILYGTICNTSIGDLFIAVVIPGLIMMVIYMATSYYFIKRRGYGKEKSTETINPKKAFLDGIWALLSPLIILGGIYGGFFTPTEAAAVACAYAIIIGLFVYKELNLNNIYRALLSASITSASIMLLCSCASFFGYAMTILRIPQIVTEVIISISSSQVMFLLLANLILLICGMFIDATTSILLVIPLLFPAAMLFGVNPIHFGVITCVNLSLGMITPPFGACMFVATGLDRDIKLEAIYKNIIPFCIIALIGVFLVTYVQPLSLLLLR